MIMGKSYSTSLLASFATIKSLSDDKKYQSPYQILAEFIRHIIVDESLYAFSAIEMKSKLNNRYDFLIPEAVIRTTAKKMAGITLNDGIYTVSESEIGTDSLFKEKRQEADNTNSDIINALAKYIQAKTDEPVNTEALTQDLISFLIDEHQNAQGKYTDLIGEFILKNEHNEKVVNGLESIKQGSILYIGLNYNISETGSLTKELTLYLGTEILFSIVGYNGEIFKQLADDFYNQVRAANSGGQRKIHLRYFADVKKEINDYFYVAQEIVDGKISSYFNKPAMIAIINGCTTAGDVKVKQSDFYHKLQQEFGIVEDPNKDYYDESQYKNNLESLEYLDDDDDRKKEIAIKYVSHINKLRNGAHPSNDIDSGYLLVTNTKTTLMVSKEQSEQIKQEKQLDTIANFAVSLDRITNLLWYKLGNGFGNKKYPVSISVALSARIVLSSNVAKNADKAFSDTKKQYENGTITEDQLAARIITLRNKPTLPEEIQGEDLDTIMDFSPDFLSRFEEQVNLDREALREKERIIATISAEKSAAISERENTIGKQADVIANKERAIIEKDATIAQQESAIKAKESENSRLQAELEKYRQKEKNASQKIARRKSTLRFIWCVVWKLLIVAAVSFGAVWLCNRVNPTYSTAIGIIVSIISLIPTIIAILKKDYKKSFRSGQ